MQRLSFFFAALLLVFFAAGGSNTGTAQSTPPVNVLITLTGENFTRQSTVFIGTAQFAPEYVSPNVLRVSIPKAMLSSAQPNNVRVVNPSAGGGSSAALPLVVACATANPIALEFSYAVKQTSFHQLDSARNTVSLSETDIAFNRVRALPVVKRTRASGTIYNDGTHTTTFTDETSAVEQPVFTDMGQDAENLRITKSTVVDHRRDTATVTMYDASGTVLLKVPLPKQSLKTLVDSLRANPSSCPGATTALAVAASTPKDGAALNATLPPLSSMELLLQRARTNDIPVERIGTSQRYKITLPHTQDILGLKFNTEATRIEAYINADPAKNVMESVHSFNGTQLLHSTYFVPRSLGACAPDYKAVVNVSYYTTPTGVAMKLVSQTDIEQMTMNNYIR